MFLFVNMVLDGKKVLIVDLNGMNADLRRLIRRGGPRRPEDIMELEGSAGLFPDKFHIELIGGDQKGGYMLAWSLNPFKLFNGSDFPGFLEHLLKSKDRIEKKLLKGRAQIDAVLIDTNYHFCNLFPKQHDDYDRLFPGFTEKEGNENLFIWFIWVYRQLKNLAEALAGKNLDDPYAIDARQVLDYADVIEAKLKNRKLEGKTPFVHVISPKVFSSMQDVGLLGILSRMGGILSSSQQEEVMEILPIRQLALLEGRREMVVFQDLVGDLKELKDDNSPSKDENAVRYFHRVLEKYVERRKVREQGCPLNLIPLYCYEKSLSEYTEGDVKDDVITAIKKYRSYELLGIFLKQLTEEKNTKEKS